MKLLVVDDDVLFRELLERTLASFYEIVTAEDGSAAWELLQQPASPQLAILDWVMPKLSGPELCRLIRQSPTHKSIYLIILTAKNSTPDVVAGLRAGADDYVVKPFDADELRARVRVGARLIETRNELAAQVASLRDAQIREQQLRTLLPLCPTCGRIRIDARYRQRLERYCATHLVSLGKKHCAGCDLAAGVGCEAIAIPYEE